jgi:hypothetical protein
MVRCNGIDHPTQTARFKTLPTGALVDVLARSTGMRQQADFWPYYAIFFAVVEIRMPTPFVLRSSCEVYCQ